MATAPSSQRPRTKSIGHYILGKTIGEGTFGKVKLGTHILTGERVAVKVLEKDRIVEVADVERVAREVHILKLIRHPHIVQLYEIIETRKQLYLIMEYASGGELFDYIVASGRVMETEAVRFFQQIIAGVEKIHAMNIVHRDLKPENLLLDDHKNIKIVDFGLSNVFRDGQLLKTACGSPCYAAPEMIAGKAYVPSLCDLWSCGVILFALVCGYLPFEDQNTAELYKKILHADYKAPKFISDVVKDLIMGLLTTEPTRRFTIPTVRAHPWYRQLTEASVKPKDLVSGQNALEEDVLLELDAFGFPRDYAVRCLELNKHNHVTTTYYLLAEKKRRMLDRLSQGDIFGSFGQSAEQDVRMEESAGPRTVTPLDTEVRHAVDRPDSARDNQMYNTAKVPYDLPLSARQAPEPASVQHTPLPQNVFPTARLPGYPQACMSTSSPSHQHGSQSPCMPKSMPCASGETPRRRVPTSGSARSDSASQDAPHGYHNGRPVPEVHGSAASPSAGSAYPRTLNAPVAQRYAVRDPIGIRDGTHSARPASRTTSGSISARAAYAASSRNSPTARDVVKTDSTRRREDAPRPCVPPVTPAAQSARARLGGRPPVPAVSPRSPGAPLSARGERPQSRASGPTTPRDPIRPFTSGASAATSAPVSARISAWNAWTAPSSRATRLAPRV